MPSVTLETFILVVISLTCIVVCYSYVPLDPPCAMNYNPLTQLNNAIQNAYSEPFSMYTVRINATMLIVVENNKIAVMGCTLPQPIISDPNLIVKSYTTEQLVYSVRINQTLIQTPCIVSVIYDAVNHILSLSCVS
jgi:hypothetical protein